VDEGAHPTVLFEIGVDEAFGFAGFDPEVLRKPERGEAVDDPEVYDLRLTAVVRCNHQRGHSKDLRGGEGVDVIATAERFDQQRVVREMGEQSKLDLRIIGS